MSSAPELHYVLGITGRSGTNFLANLLWAHPDCSAVDQLYEDYFLAELHRLTGFADAVRSRWRPIWDEDEKLYGRLVEELCRTCVAYLTGLARDPKAGHVVAKTPSVENLRLLDVMPIGESVVIVRDGRAVAESATRSWGWSLDAAARRWARGADTIMQAQEQGVKFLLVRYEDLVSRQMQEMRRVLDYLGLDLDAYDFAAADDLPVKGSSVFGRSDDGVCWSPMEKDVSFQPLKRFDHWTDKQHARFNQLAGEQLVGLGYEPRSRVDLEE